MFGLDPTLFWLAISVTLFSGFVKGAIGFAMPMIMMSAFASFLSPQMALALLILPTLVTNVMQAFRQGARAAWDSAWQVRWHIAAMMLMIAISAQFVRAVPTAVILIGLGLPIVAFALWQLSGRPLALPVHHARRAEIVSGAIGGAYGGVTGIWGPPLIVYLLSVGTSKLDQIRIQGVVFLIGAVVLTLAHLGSGVLNAQTVPLSALMVLPALLGMVLGFWVQDRLDVAQFRRWTLILLVLTGANLVRRGLEIWLAGA
ncbi:MAG: sulfite exporter TauE/SafE family protein [Paracoccus sp. (in: a-proteobacteria)]|nr:sulfite exporter TauE/SafE family protein [Paracoccus sp. (in: a-proteobacteria)]